MLLRIKVIYHEDIKDQQNIKLYENKSRSKGSSAVTNNAPDIAVGQFYLDTECIYIVARNGSSKYMLVIT